MSSDWGKDVSLLMRGAVWNWSTEKYKAYIRLINNLYNYSIFEIGSWPIKPFKVGDEKTLLLAKKAVFNYIENNSTKESRRLVMTKAKKLIDIMETDKKAVSYKVEVLAKGETRYSSNALRFATEEAAKKYAEDLMDRWFAVEEYKITPTDEPVNR